MEPDSPVDGAVLDVHICGACGYAHALRRDAAVGDVYLAAILGVDRVACKLQITAVDPQKARTLANDGLVAALDCKATRDRIRRRQAAAARIGVRIGARALDGIAGA